MSGCCDLEQGKVRSRRFVFLKIPIAPAAFPIEHISSTLLLNPSLILMSYRLQELSLAQLNLIHVT